MVYAITEALAEVCIKAGASERGACAKCGAPWERVAIKDRLPDRPGRVQGRAGDRLPEAHGQDGRAGNRCSVLTQTVGWEPTCECGVGVQPCLVPVQPGSWPGVLGIRSSGSMRAGIIAAWL